MMGGKMFDLVNHHDVGDRDEMRGGSLYSSSDGLIVDEEILSTLQKLQRYQESARVEELYNIFSLGPLHVGGSQSMSLRLSDSVAVAIVDFFHHEGAAGRQWKSLNLVRCIFNENLSRVLEGAKSSGLFSSCRILPGQDEPDQSIGILQGYCRGNSTLEHLLWWGPEFSPAILVALHETLHDDSCNIRRLDLRSDAAPVGFPLIYVLEGCQSLERLRLGRKIDLDQGYMILNLINSCPCLREIDLSTSYNIVQPFWGRSLTQDQGSFSSRRRLYRLNLPFLSDGSGIPSHNNDSGLAHESGSVAIYDREIHDLLQTFPALGDFGVVSSSSASLSLRTTRLLAFNYAGRAHLDQSLRPALWKSVLERAVQGACHGMIFLPREGSVDQKRGLLLSCQASVLFSLLKQDPTVLTVESCRVQSPSASLLASMGLL